jgi:hypothetical protein
MANMHWFLLLLAAAIEQAVSELRRKRSGLFPESATFSRDWNGMLPFTRFFIISWTKCLRTETLLRVLHLR